MDHGRAGFAPARESSFEGRYADAGAKSRAPPCTLPATPYASYGRFRGGNFFSDWSSRIARARREERESKENKISGPYEQKGKRKGAYADASGGDSLTWRRRACGDAHDDSKALTLCGSWTRGAGNPQAAWYSWPFGDTNSQRPLRN